MISIVIPVFNESENIESITAKVIPTVEGYNYEVIFIDDGSKDNSIDIIMNINKRNIRIKGISFSRNFGKESAIMAGLAYSIGDAVITIDADLQHPPEKISEFLKKWEDGAKIVEGKKTDRGHEKAVHRLFANVFYGVISKAVGKDLNNTSDYKLLDREIVDIILRLPEKQMFYRAITSWVGFKTDTVEFDVHDRMHGKTKWSYGKLVKYAIRNFTSFSAAPLQIITFFSFIYIGLALGLGLFAIIKWFIGSALQGFTTVILLELITGGIIMLALGLIGYYIAKLCDEIRNRPRYLVEKEIGYDGSELKK